MTDWLNLTGMLTCNNIQTLPASGFQSIFYTTSLTVAGKGKSRG
jgi:hypothetical protein